MQLGNISLWNRSLIVSVFRTFQYLCFFQTFDLQVEPWKEREKKVGDHVTAGGRGNLGGHEPSLPASSHLVDLGASSACLGSLVKSASHPSLICQTLMFVLDAAISCGENVFLCLCRWRTHFIVTHRVWADDIAAMSTWPPVLYYFVKQLFLNFLQAMTIGCDLVLTTKKRFWIKCPN